MIDVSHFQSISLDFWPRYVWLKRLSAYRLKIFLKLILHQHAFPRFAMITKCRFLVGGPDLTLKVFENPHEERKSTKEKFTPVVFTVIWTWDGQNPPGSFRDAYRFGPLFFNNSKPHERALRIEGVEEVHYLRFSEGSVILGSWQNISHSRWSFHPLIVRCIRVSTEHFGAMRGTISYAYRRLHSVSPWPLGHSRSTCLK